jgi:hypothetical protein
MLLVVNDTGMEKIYHIYNKQNQCVSPCLSEEEFRTRWNHLTGEREGYEYEELEQNPEISQNASY